ncbi:unnamed protein product [Calypogeia fissa]
MTTSSPTAAHSAGSTPRRFVLPKFLSAQECKELEYIHKSCGVFGYRPFVLSTTLSHLVATNCAQLIIPFLSVRERIKEAVESYFGREYELFVEFTGLISWTKGANIGWHSDDNRSYLRQRHYSAVCYLNTYEEDFKGGLFHFQGGGPSTIIPSLGTLIIYTADERNIHRVDEVTEGERCTLALWFTSDNVHDEDQKLIQQITRAVPDLVAHPSDEDPEKVLSMRPPNQSFHPLAASSVMYKADNLRNESDRVMEGNTNGELPNPYFNTTSDLRVVRLAKMGFSCCFSSTAVEDQNDCPVMLTYKRKEVPHLFSSSLEALQVAEFHQFRKATHSCTAAKEVSVSPLKADHEELDDFLNSLEQFEAYTSELWRKLFQLFPTWRTTGSITSSD